MEFVQFLDSDSDDDQVHPLTATWGSSVRSVNSTHMLSSDIQSGPSLDWKPMDTKPTAQNDLLSFSTDLISSNKKTKALFSHTKSRDGCYTCKKRKIKCQETKPKCMNCIKHSLACRYPVKFIPKFAKMVTGSQISGIPDQFQAFDMRLFHHFLIKAHPRLPIGKEKSWNVELPKYAHQHDYLIRAMLALAASDLSTSNDSSEELRSKALSYKIAAVRGLNKALSTPPKDSSEKDALFATFLILTFQASYMPDGLFDFLTMFRGSLLVSLSMRENSLFWVHHGALPMKSNAKKMKTLLSDILIPAAESANAFKHLLEHSWEKEIHSSFINLCSRVYSAPSPVWETCLSIYKLLGPLQADVSKHIFSGKMCEICKLLISHHFALYYIFELQDPKLISLGDSGILIRNTIKNWQQLIHDGLDPSFRKYNEWPMSCIKRSKDLFEEDVVELGVL